MGRFAALFLLSIILSAFLQAEGEGGIVARLIPNQVKPGELFELRVEMDRSDFATFVLEIPEQSQMRRVAVEAGPARLIEGRYLQSESWILQARSSGNIRIEGATALLRFRDHEEVVALPVLELEVLPYGQEDVSSDPIAFPQAESEEGSSWIGVVVAVLLVLLFIGFLWYRKGSAGKKLESVVARDTRLDELMTQLNAGRIDTACLETLFHERGSQWSDELREAVERILYSGGGDASKLATLLSREVEG